MKILDVLPGNALSSTSGPKEFLKNSLKSATTVILLTEGKEFY